MRMHSPRSDDDLGPLLQEVVSVSDGGEPPLLQEAVSLCPHLAGVSIVQSKAQSIICAKVWQKYVIVSALILVPAGWAI